MQLFSFSALTSGAGAVRVLVVALALVPLFTVVLFTVPALLVLPFVRGGRPFLRSYLDRMTEWTRTVLVDSQARA